MTRVYPQVDSELLRSAETALSQFLSSDVTISEEAFGYKISIENCKSESEVILQTALGSDHLLHGVSVRNPLELVVSVIDRYNEVTKNTQST